MSRIKKLCYSEYWSKDKFLKTDIFHNIMPRDRFLNLMQCLHFSNPEVSNCTDKLYKIRELHDRFRFSLKQNFYPFQNICIDESLLLFKGRLSFKQFIPSKHSRFGIKSFVACDCKTGYILDMLVYSGLETEVSVFHENLGKSGNIVMTLMKDYLGKGYSLYVDNWYTNPTLFSTLHLNQTNSCDTVKKKPENMFQIFQTNYKKEKYHFVRLQLHYV
ncbi:PiggyBac transposable element-derived protein 4 [Anthophora retusa]